LNIANLLRASVPQEFQFLPKAFSVLVTLSEGWQAWPGTNVIKLYKAIIYDCL
jgi:hypothetical protein